ncbi:hypothetical protein MLD38_016977 [Melastoma candidum]|uniref:Uncharacterized protein n=1 Tax=Melastoma candidum TaxID=119954 RepID=A0ACB9QSM6_9MYRT|nr:hypothetical protein MLD38_016977 [Melastoma candidum]
MGIDRLSSTDMNLSKWWLITTKTMSNKDWKSLISSRRKYGLKLLHCPLTRERQDSLEINKQWGFFYFVLRCTSTANFNHIPGR